jgi:hypothetical protein
MYMLVNAKRVVDNNVVSVACHPIDLVCSRCADGNSHDILSGLRASPAAIQGCLHKAH